MILRIGFDRLPYAAGRLITRKCRWSPLGKSVAILIEDSCDQQLIATRIVGTVRGFDPEATGEPLLVQLQQSLHYEGPHSCRYVDLIVVTAALRWHGPSRLLVTWAAVRLVDAPSFADQAYRSTIGIGRLTLL